MKLSYDFHIHTALSPCGENTMTPNNIVNMALLNELNVIAITDHNSCENVGAIMEVARESGAELIIIPGMEIETKEEIHIVCLFRDLDAAYKMQQIVFEHLPDIHNKAKIFGEQLILDSQDEVVGQMDKLLVQATSLSIDEVYKQVNLLEGACIPAHIDRPSNSIISNLGMLPSNLTIPTLEVSRYADYESYIKKYPGYNLLQSSDAHELGFIGICKRQLEVDNPTIISIIDQINTLKCK